MSTSTQYLASHLLTLSSHPHLAAFFKGLTPKVSLQPSHRLVEIKITDTSICLQLLVVAPKLVFSFTIAQTLIPAFGKFM